MKNNDVKSPVTIASPPPLSHRLLVDSVPRMGQHVVLKVSDTILEKIAEELDLPSVKRMEANFLIVPSRSGITRITGEVKASVEQVCVVSMEAFPFEIQERVDLRYMDADKLERPVKAEVERSLDDEDPPEPIYDGVIDLGALAVEFIALALEPFPRKSGVELPVQTDSGRLESPFAVLAALKKSPKT
jgi:uncharacterized metal-binding protein YceD (DUF177 family)